MLNYDEFLKIFAPLRSNFPDVKADKLKEDFERLNIYSPEVLKKAVSILLREYRGRTYPVFAEIYDALERAFDQIRPAEKEPAEPGVCPTCENSGYIPDLAHNKARFCSCLFGRKRRAAWVAFENNRRDPDLARNLARQAWEETK